MGGAGGLGGGPPGGRGGCGLGLKCQYGVGGSVGGETVLSQYAEDVLIVRVKPGTHIVYWGGPQHSHAHAQS